MNQADKNRQGELVRNAAVALRFTKSQGTREMLLDETALPQQLGVPNVLLG